jgi:hypothetical protein
VQRVVVLSLETSEIDCLTEPSAVAPDARVNLLSGIAPAPAVAQRDVSVIRIDFSADLRIVSRFHLESTLASGATALGSVRMQASAEPNLPTNQKSSLALTSILYYSTRDARPGRFTLKT